MTSTTSIGEAVALTSFTLFSDPRFPAEMRRKVWEMAIPPPRLVKIKVTTRGIVFDPNYDAATWYPKPKMKKTRNGLILSTHSEPPILLSVNAESREAVLEVYKGEIESRGGRKIRFDAENDIILLENRCNMGLHDPIKELLPQPLYVNQPMIPRNLESCPAYHKMFASIKNLAVDEGLNYGKIQGYEGWSLSHFESLENVFIMMTFTSQQYLITDDEQFALHETDQVPIPEMHQYLEEIGLRDIWKPELERLVALLLDYKKEFKPEWKVPAIRVKFILRDS
jgi:2EXR family